MGEVLLYRGVLTPDVVGQVGNTSGRQRGHGGGQNGPHSGGAHKKTPRPWNLL